MKTLFSLPLLLLLFVMSSCDFTVKIPMMNNQHIAIQPKMQQLPSRVLPDFHAIDAKQGAEVSYSAQGPRAIIIETNIADTTLLDVSVDSDGTLNVGYHNEVNQVSDSLRLKVTITGYKVDLYDTSSGATIHIQQAPPSASELTIEASSGGSIVADTLYATTTQLDASSGGSIDLRQLHTQSGKIEVSSGADITLGVTTQHIDADASSGGKILLSGKAQTARFEVSSAGEIDAKQLEVQKAKSDASTAGTLLLNARESTSETSTGGSVKNVAQ